MSLGDVIVQRQLTNDEAQRAIATLFGFPVENVLVVNDLTELLSDAKQRRVLCHKWDLSGGCFHTVLSLNEGEWMDRPPLPMAMKLSVLLDCACLISDQTVNPYSWILVSPTGTCQPVKLHAQQFDNDVYEITEPTQPSKECAGETHVVPG